MKKLVLNILLGFVLSVPLYGTPEAWCNQLLEDNPTNKELSLVLNLLYFSYARSAATGTTQKAYLEHLEYTLKAGQNIHHTRMNPSRALPYQYALAQAEQTYADFIRATTNYHVICATYAEATEYILKFYKLSSNVKSAITNLRQQARTAIASAATSEASDFLQSFDLLQKIINKTEKKRSQFSIPTQTIQRSLVSFIARWIPLAAVSSFISYDAQFNTITEQWWKTLINSYELNNNMWHIFETARAKFYKTHYTIFYEKLKAIGTDQEFFLQAFNEIGFIALENRDQPLPEPDTLPSTI